MRIVIALGGNALLRRGEPLTTEVQRRNVAVAAVEIAPLAGKHEIVVVHGNGPQVGLLALQAAAYPEVEPYPLDVLDAGTQGLIGYLIQQELRSALPPDHRVATLLTMVEVDPDDPAFSRPTKFVGPTYGRDAVDALQQRGWTFRQDGAAWRRVVPSPLPQRIVEVPLIVQLLDHRTVVVCAGGGGIPVLPRREGHPEVVGVEAVVDKDLTSELLAENVGADLFIMATDVDGVYLDWGEPTQRKLGRVAPEDLAGHEFAAGSMGPKVVAALRFAGTGGRAVIGSLSDIHEIVTGDAGTIFTLRS